MNLTMRERFWVLVCDVTAALGSGGSTSGPATGSSASVELGGRPPPPRQRRPFSGSMDGKPSKP
jgi:hypothetical protein